MKVDGPKNPDFHWQAGYAAFSVSHSNLGEVRRYIENHEDHHRKMTFQDELRALFSTPWIEFDERFVWTEWGCFALSGHGLGWSTCPQGVALGCMLRPFGAGNRSRSPMLFL